MRSMVLGAFLCGLALVGHAEAKDGGKDAAPKVTSVVPAMPVCKETTKLKGRHLAKVKKLRLKKGSEVTSIDDLVAKESEITFTFPQVAADKYIMEACYRQASVEDLFCVTVNLVQSRCP